MKTVNSLSGGQTSSYIAAHYPADHNLFALVRIESESCRFPDEKIRREVEDRIQAPFIATAEDDKIIYTMLDLEQFIGQKINWVTGMTYEEYIQRKNGGCPPNLAWRSCTTWLKLVPMAQWWLCNVGEPVRMQVGFRANETERANNTLAKLNKDGFAEIKIPVATKKTKTRWQTVNKVVAWQRQTFPLIEDGVFKHEIQAFWRDKPVRFADYNNCIGCFHRAPHFLAKMFDIHPTKMQWFADMEKKGTWRKDIRYENLKKWRVQRELSFADYSACDTGFCEVA
jgi:hypothetical protein